jgi:molybdopterin/thiamine biosynthesis adenylyltransferase
MDQNVNRYSRHELLKELGTEGQAKIRAAKVLIIGAGGLGSPASLYLTSAGVGKITIVDGDTVDLTNLQRQVVHSTERVGIPKALSAKISLQAVNPEVELEALVMIPDEEQTRELVRAHDIILDCTDNTKSRYRLNRICWEEKKPLVSAGCVCFTGQVSVFDFRQADSACYACLFPNHDGNDEKASTLGVFAPLVGILGCTQASEALKLIAGIGEPLVGRLFMIDALTMDVQVLKYRRNKNCPCCGNKE